MKSVGLREVVFFGRVMFASSGPQEQDKASKGDDHLIYGQIKREPGYLFKDEPFTLTFHPNKKSLVNAPNYEISSNRNESVEVILFDGNGEREFSETINFLPVKVDTVFPNLIFYSVYNCAVEVVTKKNFRNLRKLMALSLILSNIEVLDEDSFDDLQKLNILNLLYNKIEILPDKIFQNLHELKSLRIESNPISALSDEHFKNNKKLKSISLAENRIKFLSPTMFDGLSALRSVSLIDNLCVDKDYFSRTEKEFGIEDLIRLLEKTRFIDSDYLSTDSKEFKNFGEYLSEFKNDVTVNCSRVVV